ncbi:AAA family ATPase [Microbacterium sp. A82]|uniref:AAA family ATPase n=1 Tax=Microbacterium sp. A82 TaxID=3450452 RepID=UPI003F34F037
MTDARQLLLTPASQIPIRRQRWFWQDRVPMGTATIFAGHGGEGKSTFALYLSALAIKGELEGDLRGIGSNILIISHEDDWGTVMNPRLVGAGASLDNVFRLSVETTVDEVTAETVPALPMDLNLIRQAITDTDARLLIIDPITSTIGGDLYKVADVRRALDPLAALAQELDIAVIGIMHFNKGTGNASNKLSGSHGFRDVVRSLLLFATDDETEQRIVTVDKSNYSKERGASFAFNLVSTDVAAADGEITSVGAVEYLGETDISVSDIINRMPSETEGVSDERNAAQAFLLDYFNGREAFEAAAGDVLKAGRAAGFTDTDIKNARRRCRNPRIESQKSGFGAGWVWAIVHEGVTEGAQGATSQKGDTLGTFVTPSTPREPQGSQGSHLSERENYENDGFCPVCAEPVGMINLDYCDTSDTAHANHRADAAVTA